jgi:hypothetical protein
MTHPSGTKSVQTPKKTGDSILDSLCLLLDPRLVGWGKILNLPASLAGRFSTFRWVAFVTSLALAACSAQNHQFDQQAPRALVYGESSRTGIRLTEIVPMAPSSTQVGNPDLFEYSISPALPEGLEINRRTGVIRGASQVELWPAKSFVVKLKNHGGEVSTTIQLGIKAIAPTRVTYPLARLTAVQGDVLDLDPTATETTGHLRKLFPSVNSESDPVAFKISPATLQSAIGLGFLESTGEISGPATNSTGGVVTYTITAWNSGGEVSTPLEIDIRGPVKLASEKGYTSVSVGDVLDLKLTGGIVDPGQEYALSIVSGPFTGVSAPQGASAKVRATGLGKGQLRIADSRGHTSDLQIDVSAALTVAITDTQTPKDIVILGEKVSLQAQGGFGPYTYSDQPKDSGNWGISGSVADGVNTFAAKQLGSITLTVGDQRASEPLHTSSIAIDVRKPIALGPTSGVRFVLGSSASVSPADGVVRTAADYRFSQTPVSTTTPFVSTGGTVSTQWTGTEWKITGTKMGRLRLRALDLKSNVSSEIIVDVYPQMSLGLDATEVQQDETVTATVSGGIPPFTYRVSTGEIASPAGPTAQASSSAMLTTVSNGTPSKFLVQDSTGYEIGSEVQVRTKITLVSADPDRLLGQKTNLTTTGGVSGARTFTVSPSNRGSVSGTGTQSDPYVFTAGPQAGAATVQVRDSRGNSAQVAIQVFPVLSLGVVTPAVVGEDNLLTISGGNVTAGTDYRVTVNPPTSASVSGDGSGSNPFKVRGLAPVAAPGVTVTVSDLRNNQIQKSIVIVPQPTLALSQTEVLIGEAITATVSGGIPDYRYSATGPGALVMTPAGPTPLLSSSGSTAVAGSYSVRVLDRDGRSSTQSLSVRSAIAITLAQNALVVGETSQIDVTGGITPLGTPQVTPSSLAAISGAGTTVSPFVLTALQSGTGQVSVRDARGTVAQVSFEVRAPLALGGGALNLLVSRTKTVAVTGGYSPYTFSVTGGASVSASASSADLTGTAVGNFQVRVRDQAGRTAVQPLQVFSNLTLTPPRTNLTIGQQINLGGAGGVPGTYTFSLVPATGWATFTPASNSTPTTVLQAVSALASGSIVITDSDGNSTTIPGFSVIAPPTFGTDLVKLAVGDAAVMTLAGGYPNFVYSATGGGTITPSSSTPLRTATYTATTPGNFQISVQDASTTQASVPVRVYSALALSATPTTLFVTQKAPITVSGGVMDAGDTYEFTVIPSDRGRVIGSSGAYQFEALASNSTTGESVTLEVRDRAAPTRHVKSITLKLKAIPAMTLSPSGPLAQYVGEAVNFSASGGIGPLEWRKQSIPYVPAGDGTLSALTGLASTLTPTTAGTLDVFVEDSTDRSRNRSTQIKIYDRVTLSSSLNGVYQGQSTPLTAAGGKPRSGNPYVITVTPSTLGTVTPVAPYVFTASNQVGNATITFSDGGSAPESSAQVTVSVQTIPPVTISPASATILTGSSGNTQQFTAGGGLGTYRWFRIPVVPYSENIASITAPSNVATVTSVAVGQVDIRVEDARDATRFAVARLAINDPIPPLRITGAPTGTTQTFDQVTVGVTGGLSPYTFSARYIDGTNTFLGFTNGSFAGNSFGWVFENHGRMRFEVTDRRGVSDYFDVVINRRPLGNVKLVSGSSRTCGISYGEVYCWGWNSDGAVVPALRSSNPSLAGVYSPTRVVRSAVVDSIGTVPVFRRSIPEEAVDVTVSGSTTCALTKSGKIYCWGNSYRTNTYTQAPLDIVQLTGFDGDWRFSSIAASSFQMCGYGTLNGTNGTYFCWPMAENFNFSTLGNDAQQGTGNYPPLNQKYGSLNYYFYGSPGVTGPNEPNWTKGIDGAGRVSPVALNFGLSGGRQPLAPNKIAVGKYHVCILAPSPQGAVPHADTLYCLGANDFGQVTGGLTTNDTTSNTCANYPFANTGTGYPNTLAADICNPSYSMGSYSKVYTARSYTWAGPSTNFSHPIVDVSASDTGTCVLADSVGNRIFCWGYDGGCLSRQGTQCSGSNAPTRGTLGNDSSIGQLAPVCRNRNRPGSTTDLSASDTVCLQLSRRQVKMAEGFSGISSNGSVTCALEYRSSLGRSIHNCWGGAPRYYSSGNFNIATNEMVAMGIDNFVPNSPPASYYGVSTNGYVQNGRILFGSPFPMDIIDRGPDRYSFLSVSVGATATCSLAGPPSAPKTFCIGNRGAGEIGMGGDASSNVGAVPFTQINFPPAP